MMLKDKYYKIIGCVVLLFTITSCSRPMYLGDIQGEYVNDHGYPYVQIGFLEEERPDMGNTMLSRLPHTHEIKLNYNGSSQNKIQLPC